MQNQVAVIKHVQELAKGRNVSFYWDGNRKFNNSINKFLSLILPAASAKRPGH